MVTDMRMFSLKLKNFRIGENFERYLLLIAAVLFVGVFGVEGFAYTIILFAHILADFFLPGTGLRPAPFPVPFRIICRILYAAPV